MQRLASALEGRLAGLQPLLYKAPSKVGVWLSLVEHRVRDAGVAGSNPATPTNSSRRHEISAQAPQGPSSNLGGTGRFPPPK